MSEFDPTRSFVSLPDDLARQMLDEALVRLSPVQRQAVTMRLRGVADVDGIAERLGLPEETVRASLAFAVAQLRMALSDAPLDRRHNDWLHRCRALHTAPPDRSRAPDRASEAALPAPVQPGAHLQPAAGAGRQMRWAVVLGLLVLAGVMVWQFRQTGSTDGAPSKVETGPQRMPPPNAPEAPLTAPDFLLVLLQQQHPGVLEDLEFHVWLAEQEALQ
ncbi:hypothetical protein OS187_12575 [Xanthomonadaceae bacterium JHOS43]|nr:hypothetical protein [Xanthomonadaceae bacterium JHOS43]